MCIQYAHICETKPWKCDRCIVELLSISAHEENVILSLWTKKIMYYCDVAGLYLKITLCWYEDQIKQLKH